MTNIHAAAQRPAIRMKSLRRPGSSAFTLIEIVVVLAVLSIVAAIVFPRLPSSDREKLKSSARRLASTLRYAGDRAATGRTVYFLRMEPGSGEFKVLEQGGDGSRRPASDPLLQKSVLDKGIAVADVTIPRLGKISEGEVVVAVDAGGYREPLTIHLQSQEGEFQTLMVFPAGGKVKLFEGYQVEVP